MKHYHWHVTFQQGNRRFIDSIPWTDEQAALRASIGYFSEEEKPKVIKVDATDTCGWATHRY